MSILLSISGCDGGGVVNGDVGVVSGDVGVVSGDVGVVSEDG